MNKKIIGLVIFISLLSAAGFACLPTGTVFAQTSLTNPISYNDFGALLENVATTVGTLIASLGAVMIIIAGIFYLTSAGSPERIGVAKKALMYAIAGIVIGLAADAIVSIIKKTVGG